MKLERHHNTDRTLDLIYLFLGIGILAMFVFSTWRILSLVTKI